MGNIIYSPWWPDYALTMLTLSLLLALNSRSRPEAAAMDKAAGNLKTVHCHIADSRLSCWEKSMSCDIKPEFGEILGLASLVVCKASARLIFSPAQYLDVHTCPGHLRLLTSGRNRLIFQGVQAVLQGGESLTHEVEIQGSATAVLGSW